MNRRLLPIIGFTLATAGLLGFITALIITGPPWLMPVAFLSFLVGGLMAALTMDDEPPGVDEYLQGKTDENQS